MFGWGPADWDHLDDWELELWAKQAEVVSSARSR